MLNKNLKILLSLIAILLIKPSFAGEYEDAISNYEKVLLYLYTPQCSYCSKFEPNYNKLLDVYRNDCKFLKINGETNYGNKLARMFGIKFVPYVLLVEKNKSHGLVISPSCLLEYSCVNNVLSNFVK
jgi:thiol-disulfide isomerase/thioredoxin